MAVQFFPKDFQSLVEFERWSTIAQAWPRKANDLAIMSSFACIADVCSSCLPSLSAKVDHAHTILHSFFPSHGSSFLHTFLPSFIQSFLPSHIPSFLNAILPSFAGKEKGTVA